MQYKHFWREGSRRAGLRGAPSKLATVHEGSSHTLNTQFGALYNQSNELVDAINYLRIFLFGEEIDGFSRSLFTTDTIL